MTENKSPVINDLLIILSSSCLPEQRLDFSEALDANLIRDHVTRCEINLLKAIEILKNISTSVSVLQPVIIKSLLLCGEHGTESEAWTSKQTVDYAKNLVKILLLKSDCTNLTNLLLLCKVDTFLSELRPKLLKTTWKNYPAAISCFMWILFHVKCPYLGDIFDSVLPTCLLLIDDHEDNNKIRGLQCLQHVTSNVSQAELNQYGRGLVIYSALNHMIYSRESKIIRHLAECLAILLSKTENKATTSILLWSHFDDVLNVWLPSMKMEDKLALREAYIDSLNILLQKMGLASVRWSNSLLSVFSEYCEQEHTQDKTLLVMETFIRTAWPRISANFDNIIIILMKVLIRISKTLKPDNNFQSTLILLKECFELLEDLCTAQYNTFLNELQNCHELKYCYDFITRNKNYK